MSDINIASILDDTDIRFEFIVRFMFTDGTHEDWTSNKFLNDLQQAQQNNNPFFSRDRVTVAEINYQQLARHCNNPDFLEGEDYAEVKITQTIGTHRDIAYTDSTHIKKEILKHISWIVADNSDDELRRPIEDNFGNWELYTSQFVSGSLNGSLGFTDSEFNDEDEPDPIVTQTPISTSTGQAPPASISTYPFSTRGDYIGEKRKYRKSFFRRITYIWTVSGWVRA